MASIDDEIKTELDSLTRMAKRLGLKGKEASAYVREHMIKLGYEAQTHTTYTRKQADRGNGGGWSFFGGGGSSDDDGDDGL